MKFVRLFVVSLLLVPLNALGGTGAKLYNEFMDSDALYPDPEWQEYIDDLGQKLLSHSKDRGKQYHFFVLDNPEINAFATADAYIFVNRGLLAYMGSEDQLAAVVGHEIAHIVARHPDKRRAHGILGDSIGIIALALTGRWELMEAADAATRTMIMGYGREHELEADEIGAQIMARAGYNPLATIEAVHVLKDQELFAMDVANQPRSYHGLFATHPQNDKRLHEVVSYALDMLPEIMAEPSDRFWEMIDGLSYGSDSTVGINTDNVFYDKTLRIAVEFPKAWDVSFNRQKVVGVAPNGESEALLSVSRITPEDWVDYSDFLKNTLHVTNITSESTLDIPGCCQVHIADLAVDGTTKKRSLIGLRIKGSDVFVIQGEAGPRGNSDDLLVDMKSTLAGIRNLQVADMKKAKTKRIKVIVAKPGDTYKKLADQSSLRNYPEETLRLINGHHPHSEPRAGDKIKIVQ
ncbi:MAG: M48 family metalloprotease [Gammaproteobacteria bacterium]|nr:M48 family metalloprotease [Gammaproteobacteria bacterium]